MTIKDRILIEIDKYNDSFKVKDFHDRYFLDIPYETFRKCILRMEKEGLLEAVDRGIYKKVGLATLSTDNIAFYLDNNQGMFIGEKLLFDLGVIKNEPEIKGLISNKCYARNKRLDNYLIQPFGMELTEEVKKHIFILELSHNRGKEKPENIDTRRIIQLIPTPYNDELMREIIKKLKTKSKYILILKNILDSTNIQNSLEDFI